MQLFVCFCLIMVRQIQLLPSLAHLLPPFIKKHSKKRAGRLPFYADHPMILANHAPFHAEHVSIVAVYYMIGAVYAPFYAVM